MKEGTQMNIQAIEGQILELLVKLIKANEHALAEEFIDELVKLIQQFIPTSNLGKMEKVSWVDIRNILETNITNAVVQSILALVTLFGAKTSP